MNNDNYMDETGPYEPNPRNYREFSGYIYCKRVRTTGSIVSIVDGEGAKLDTNGGRWYNICETHKELVQHPIISLANQASSHPEEWCSKCKIDYEKFGSKLAQYKRPRDSQRQKVYDAEKPFHKTSERIETIPEISRWLHNEIFTSEWFKENYPEAKYFRLHDGRAARTAKGWFDAKERVAHMKLPKWSRCKFVILHELAHGVCQSVHGKRKVAGHGKEWAGIFMHLLRKLCPTEYESLKVEYKLNKVKYEK